jgi:hypothetical protein
MAELHLNNFALLSLDPWIHMPSICDLTLQLTNLKDQLFSGLAFRVFPLFRIARNALLIARLTAKASGVSAIPSHFGQGQDLAISDWSIPRSFLPQTYANGEIIPEDLSSGSRETSLRLANARSIRYKYGRDEPR